MGVASNLGPEAREDLRRIREGQVKWIRMGDFWRLVGMPVVRFERLAQLGIIVVEEEGAGARTRQVKLSPRGKAIFHRSASH